MRQIEVGDYVLGKDSIWQIKAIRKDGVNLVYDLDAVKSPADFLEVYDWASGGYQTQEIAKEMLGISHSYLRHLGEIVPKDSEKAIKILFGE